MTVTLGSVTLSDDLVLLGIDSSPLVAYSVTPTLGGVAVVQSDDHDDDVGIELRLQGENHFTLQNIIDVRALRGQTVSLVHHRGTYSVIVIDTPTEPTIDYANPVATDWHSGEIIMVTV